MPSSINFEEFIVTRTDNEKCEFEVTSKAMDYYKKYPCYNGDKWESIDFQNSIYVYYSSNGKERKEYENKTAPGYKGAHLLVNKDKNIALTSDIFTSIYHPVTSLIFECKSLDGEGLSNMFKNMNICEYSKDMKGMYPYMKAFATVYYWCGNMMPVICNWRGANDEAVYKIKTLIESPKEGYIDFNDMKNGKVNGRNVKPTKLLPSWRNKMWAEWKVFVTDNYLDDYFENDSIKKIPLWCECYNDDLRKEWFIINTKLIIQRSYRINNKLTGNEWCEMNRYLGDTHEKYVQDIMKIIFSEVGIPEDKKIELF